MESCNAWPLWLSPFTCHDVPRFILAAAHTEVCVFAFSTDHLRAYLALSGHRKAPSSCLHPTFTSLAPASNKPPKTAVLATGWVPSGTGTRRGLSGHVAQPLHFQDEETRGKRGFLCPSRTLWGSPRWGDKLWERGGGDGR